MLFESRWFGVNARRWRRISHRSRLRKDSFLFYYYFFLGGGARAEITRGNKNAARGRPVTVSPIEATGSNFFGGHVEGNLAQFRRGKWESEKDKKKYSQKKVDPKKIIIITIHKRRKNIGWNVGISRSHSQCDSADSRAVPQRRSGEQSASISSAWSIVARLSRHHVPNRSDGRFAWLVRIKILPRRHEATESSILERLCVILGGGVR